MLHKLKHKLNRSKN